MSLKIQATGAVLEMIVHSVGMCTLFAVLTAHVCLNTIKLFIMPHDAIRSSQGLTLMSSVNSILGCLALECLRDSKHSIERA